MNNSLGIYFGPHTISIVETKGRQLVRDGSILQSLISSDAPAENKIPEEVKLLTLLKDEAKRKNFEAKDVTLSLSGKDLIIRTFEIPIMPRDEIGTAVNFEVRKYIPFKLEDLVSDFQWKTDKSLQKNRILFVGIKRDLLERYLSVVKELNLKVNAVEYSSFSVLRLLKLGSLSDRTTIAVVDIDIAENEVNFLVAENGFPVFSRDITFAVSETELEGKDDEERSEVVIDKLRRELRVSLDYYDRTFPLKNINKVYFIMSQDYFPEVETFAREMGLNFQFVNFNKCAGKYLGKVLPFSLAFVKSYCSSLSSQVSISLKIDLLSAKERMEKKVVPGEGKERSIVDQLKAMPLVYLLIPVASLFICLVTFVFGVYRMLPLQKEFKEVVDKRPLVYTVSPDKDDTALVAAEVNYREKIRTIEEIANQQVYLTEILNIIPRIIVKEIRLTDLSFKKEGDKPELLLRGTAYAGDSNKEVELVNTFLSALKANSVCAKYFKTMAIQAIDHTTAAQGKSKTNFLISCTN